jgi:3-oxoacyl-[acyl-carrier protein] reductase
MSKLNNKTALVTGASRGIGRATALALAREGAHVIVHYSKARAQADEVVKEIQKAGGTAAVVETDLAAPDGAHKLASGVKQMVGDRLDILVANAGISKSALVEEITVEDFDRLFAVNVRAPFFLVQQLAPLLGDGSSITLLTSVAARAAVGNLAAYAATKGAISTLVRYFAVALGARNIRVNGVAPGVIDTDMSSFTRTEEGRNVALSIQALKRLGRPEDIGDVVAFLASEDARWITGDIIEVGGGTRI